MNLFEYVPLMKEMGTPCAVAGIVILVLFLVIIILKMLGGMRRGGWRQLVRTAATLVAAIASYVVAVNMSNSIIGALDVTSLESLIVQIEAQIPDSGDAIREALAGINTEIIEYLLLLPATLFIIPLLTTVIFLLINLVLKIIRAIVIKVIGFKKAKSNPQRLGGAFLSAIEALIWIVMVTLPISAVGTLATEAFDEAINSAEGEQKAELTEIYNEYILPFTENPAVCFIENLGGEAMADGIATVSIDGEKTNTRKDVLTLTNVILVNSKELSDADYSALNGEEKAAVSSIIDSLAQSPLMSRILVNVINVIPEIYEIGLFPTDFEEDYTDVVDELMKFLKALSPENLGEDLTTIKEFYFGFCDSGLFSALTDGDDIMKFVNDDYKNDRHILGMINTLSENPRTKGIVDGLYNMVLNAAFSNAKNDNTAEGDSPSTNTSKIEIADVKAGLNNIVSVNKKDYETEEEYREVLSDTISATINDTIGVELEKETVGEIADYIDENYAERIEDLTDEEFNELVFEVIDIYQNYLNGD